MQPAMERTARSRLDPGMQQPVRSVPWWHDGVIYQIYPRSFQDTDGDGVGDLAGIRRRLPYLRSLGIDALWLSPIFQSPMKDFGYDIADYRAIDPLFGDMAQFDALLAEAHEAGLKLILDLVPNHTSDRHEWFEQSRSSRDNPRRDWYIWKDPAPDGGPPNNWISNFGGPAWTFDETSGQYYYHAFLASQPDLNWRNDAVREAMFEVMRFWLDKGVDGFRVDVIWHLIKDEDFRDNPPNPDWEPGQSEINRNLQIHSADQPEIHDVIEQMRDVLASYQDRLLIGEIYLPLERLMRYYGTGGETGVHLPFNFQLLQCAWEPERIAALIDEYEAALPEDGWPNWVLSNHDQPRIAARAGQAQAANAALLLLTLRGTPTLYYGDELAIGEVEVPPDRIQDPWAKREPDASFNRDKARTPMQWSHEDHAGFSPSEPWLPLTGDWQTRNVAALEQEPHAILQLHRRLLALRHEEEVLRRGSYARVLLMDGVFGYERRLDDRRIAVFLNFTNEPCELRLPQAWQSARVVLSTKGSRKEAVEQNLMLAPDEGVILKPGER